MAKAKANKLYNVKLTFQPGAPQPQLRLEGLKEELIRSAAFGPNNTLLLTYPST